MAAPLFSHTNLPFLLNELTTDRQRCFYLAIKKQRNWPFPETLPDIRWPIRQTPPPRRATTD
jgi:hypothetical protein